MLNPRWKVRYDPKDFKEWQKVEATTPPFFEFSFVVINNLLAKYFRTKKGYELGPTSNWYQRKEILARTMAELERAVIYDEAEHKRRWQENQEAEESLDAKLEREKGMYEARNSSRISSRMNKISKRQNGV